MSNNFKKPYCKVCHDAGRSEKEYTSHWVKDRSGKTLCPTLLDTECRYCFKLGHTAKFCDVLAKNNKAKEKALSKEVKKSTEIKVSQKRMPTNSFAALECDSDSEQEEIFTEIAEVIRVEEYPALTAKNVEVRLPVSSMETGWAAIAAKPATFKEVKAQVSPILTTGRDYSKPIYTKSWADWTDSDSDEDDEMPSVNQVLKSEPMPSGWSTNFSMEDEDW